MKDNKEEAVVKRLIIKDICIKDLLFHINYAKGTVHNEFLFIVQQPLFISAKKMSCYKTNYVSFATAPFLGAMENRICS